MISVDLKASRHVYCGVTCISVHEKLNLLPCQDDAWTTKAQALCSKAGKPSGVAGKLREMFPSLDGIVPKKRPSSVFDPLSECVAESQKWKKSVNQRMKPQNFTVVVLKKYASRVPQRTARN